jgi:hypothetical protein
MPGVTCLQVNSPHSPKRPKPNAWMLRASSSCYFSQPRLRGAGVSSSTISAAWGRPSLCVMQGQPRHRTGMRLVLHKRYVNHLLHTLASFLG